MPDDNRIKATRREWIGLAVIALPCMLYSMDLTVLDLAIPRLTEDLRPSGAQLLWILDIYGFLVAGSLITMGTLGDRIGRRRLLLIGAATFGAASVLAAFSSSAPMLIVTRALLGIAGATLAPSTLSLIRSMFLDPEQRTVAIGVWVTSFSIGAAIGPLLGGIVLEYFWWGAVFLLGVPAMLLLLVLGPLLLPEYRDPKAGRLDVTSAVESLVAVLLVIYGLKHMAEEGPGWAGVTAIAGGLAVGTAFVRRQRALSDPLIDLDLFRVPAFSVSLATYALGTFVAFTIYVFLAQYLQLVLGLSPLRAGLATVPAMLAFIAGSAVVPRMARRVRPASAMAGGLAVTAAGFVVLAGVETLGLPGLIAGSVIYSVGLTPVVILATDLIVGSAPVERAGAASAISETGSELGGALGIALLGSLATAVYRGMMASWMPTGVPRDVAEDARATLGGAVQAARALEPAQGADLVATARAAFTQAFEVTALVCAGLAVLAAIGTVLVLRESDARPEEVKAAA
ncbi:MAG TPA: MFS transporter [Gemmatimonadales bacterium]|nr:MFS transporter [Gemmatimonadales bacterium]